MRNAWARGVVAALVLGLSACSSLSGVQRERVDAVIASARPTDVACLAPDRCAQPSPLRALGTDALRQSAVDAPRHYALIIDNGPDAMLARLDLIRGAQQSIDLQTYIFDEDDAGRLVLDELIQAARRGVRVRVLMDQLSALRRVDTLAALSAAHANLEVRLYNPVLGRARINYPQYAVAAACCWRQLNQRMHSKMLLVDGLVGITGGRNYQNDYYDWDPQFNFRDRDLLVAGPVAATMDADFGAFWNDARSVPAHHLRDVGKRLLGAGVPRLPAPDYERPARAAAMQALAADAGQVQARLAVHALPVGPVQYISDKPAKQDRAGAGQRWSSESLRELIESAQNEVLLQTPYLVLSKPAQDMFRRLHDRPEHPRVIVSTNSLAATDAFIAYALSYKYKRRYLRDFGFHIYEYKPFPLDAPIDLAATGAPLDEPTPTPGHGPAEALAMPGPGSSAAPYPYRAPHRASPPPAPVRQSRNDIDDPRAAMTRTRYRAPLSSEQAAKRYTRRRVNEPVPLKRAGVRVGLHAKSLVIDRRVGVVGTHNFDPRGDHYNTESAVMIEDPVFAAMLADSIRRDIAPENAWVIAPREKAPVFSGLEYSLGKASEHLPLFDLWPVRYAISYEFTPGPRCPAPLPIDHKRFRDCYRAVGDFPEVNLGLKSITTRIFTAFGAGLAPIL
ncbi:phospholipase D family protein [Lysobacter solisilvae]|uniref:Phospholipase D family protein n=1 Tax=Agrilutibacter solisilvae TaxID=2763317 RepID=A0A975AU49_9GAMM|nr:phospholipase D family protein [Lysobacter solisilvae]